MRVSFTVNDVIELARIGSEKLVADRRKTGISNWEGILPGPDSETFDDIKNALMQRFPDGVIVADIA